MTNRKNTKRALFTSVISMLLCVTMLIGSTFAWFTDNAQTGVNSIEAGTLRVDLVDANDASLEGKSLVFDKAGSNELWEPGQTWTLQDVYVKNNGNLALKYRITITGIQGDAELNEVITWTIKVGDETVTLTNGVSQEFKLAANAKSPLLSISGTMDQNAGNKYQGMKIEGISIKVEATQDTVEHDSTTDQYDKDAQYGEDYAAGNGGHNEPASVWDGTVSTLSDDLVIDDAAEFAAFAAAVNAGDDFAGKTVKLNMCIDLNNQAWTSISSFAGTFDGQGHNVSNMTGNLFGTVSGTVKDLRVMNVEILNTTKNGANGFIGTVAAGGVIDNCNVSGVDIKWTAEVNAKDTTDGFGGVIASVQAGATVQNCEFSDITVTSNGKTKRTGAVFSSITGTVKGCVFTNVNFTVADTDTLEGWVTSHGGGLAGDVNGGAVVENCKINNMQVNVYEAAGHVGGIFGKAHISGQTAPITLKDITVNGLTMKVGNTLESMKCVAGFIAQPDSRSNDVRVAIDNCHINGLDMTLASSKQGESAAAGFISGLCGGVDVTNCSVSGKIDGTNTPANIGGFIGDAGWYGAIEQNFTDCSTNVNITVKDSIGGGFIAVDGTLGNAAAILNFNNCQATGTVTVVDGGTGTAAEFCGKTIE